VTRFFSEPLTTDHDRSDFDSGEATLDDWLRASALHAEAMRTGRSFVWHTGDDRVVGFFTLTAHLIEKDALPPSLGRGSPRQIPAVLLARLALDRSLHGTGLGTLLLWDGASRAVTASESVGARLLLVDALHDRAAGFYEHLGFSRLPRDPFRLVRKMSDVAASLR